jgi:TnpA family transposase
VVSINRRNAVQACLGIKARPHLKNNQHTQERVDGVFTKHEALSSSPNTVKKYTVIEEAGEELYSVAKSSECGIKHILKKIQAQDKNV